MHNNMPISHRAIAQLMPMHVWLTPDGRIRAAGRCFQKLCRDCDLEGRLFTEVFDIRRPRSARSINGLLKADGVQLQLSLIAPPHTTLKGVVVPLEKDGGVLINLSFGIAVVDAVADFGLTLDDFAATDLTVELLYLVEAKAAVMDELRKLNTRLQGARIAAEEQAFTDTLTGLKNRRALEHVTARLQDHGQDFGLMHLDLDYFKAVNDTYGHAAGDHVLQQVAKILVEETRVNDTVVRIGGDEFVLVFEGPIDMKRLDRVAHRIIERLEAPISYDGAQCSVSASIGTTMSSFYQSPDWETMQRDADMALYASKRAGRSRVTLAAIQDRRGQVASG
ncbi:diguanylate cyclase [Actibacterium atlanticum]|uniref:guanylate cyclase n=2 Tax=Actibacterium atlanticum TaxID=1461693 RepID=A0A058ZIS0_9RHOB|nr:diguanylate cyclase [Actibacterium atlanticum]